MGMQPEFSSPSQPGGIDAEYRFGRPKVYLTAHEIARLTLVRSRLGDTAGERAAESLNPSSGLPIPAPRSGPRQRSSRVQPSSERA